MKGNGIFGFALGTVAGALALIASPAMGGTVAVCPVGCPYASIQAGINAATPGDTVAVGDGTYIENVVVNKSLTLQGERHRGRHKGDGDHRDRDGDDPKKVTILPAISNANPCPGSSLCGGAASNIILVEADNVTIDGFTLDGDNPSLTSGIIRGDADLDARNGIITNHLTGVWNDLTVSNVTMRNIYLRGIYASSGGTFDFHDNTVTNVQGDSNSIAMFNFGGAGVMKDNKVSFANDAISSNHSTGIQFLNNAVTHSGSGLHTDNAGDGGGTADLIQDNTVTHCQTDGYGIWVFVPYIAPVVKRNEIHGCTVGLAAFGQGNPVTTLFKDNHLNGAGASSSDTSNSFGVIVSTDRLGFGANDVSASFTDNVLRRFNTGVYVEQHCELFGSIFNDCASGGGQATATLHKNVIQHNGTGADGMPDTSVNAEHNWWGCKEGPNQPGCDTAIGTIDFTPWLSKRPK